jgi:hypothetical protein
VLGESATVDDHEHRVRIVEYEFDDGTITPFVEVSERREGYSGHRLVHLSDVVHVLLNVGEMELFQIGNRERDYRGAVTDERSSTTRPCCTSEPAETSRRA